ncbi:ThiF family adenylyltransferase [Bradyrhizobium sp. RP6]|uniref:ThiF family adenylyltransferase n=1 Tax=Bradyrhizobium sp. RP6 TaxID=2489596 RepID=UPI000F53260E|nr:ThiF family adenylyltransferase [Bradyrhizobium sp. RP6]RQH12692.1 hypothetical protein EHH60_14465 [Bradyrhizobium sp. RP6]
MLHPWLQNWGEPCDPPALQNTLAVSLVGFAAGYAEGVAEIVGARRNGPSELLVVAVQTGRPQRPAYPLLKVETVGVLFPGEGVAPIVLALRSDFPDTPHQNWVPAEIPACICIDDRPWVEARQTYTSGQLLFRIVSWFKRAGMGELHDVGRAPDPFFTGQCFELIVPRAVLTPTAAEQPDLVGFINSMRGRPVVIAQVYSPERHKAVQSGGIVVSSYSLPAQHMRRLRHVPANLAELCAELSGQGIDLAADLSAKIDVWAGIDRRDAFRLASQLAVVVTVPMLDPNSGEISRADHVALVTQRSVGVIGVALGRLYGNESEVGNPAGFVRRIPPAAANEEMLRSIPLLTASVHAEFDQQLAATMSGLGEPDIRKAVMVGAGAIGSGLSEMLVREGRFAWTIVDSDHLLPHNLARHTLGLNSYGAFKAQHVAGRLESIRAGIGTKAIVADFLEPHEAELTQALEATDVIIDTSASVPVARAISDLGVNARRASAFFNPAGNASVLMVQDRAGEFDLRALEAAYYGEVLTNPNLVDHLAQSASTIVYAGACRSVTNRIPASRAATLTGLTATALSTVLDRDDALMRIWSMSETGTVHVATPVLEPPTRHRSLWDVYVSPKVERRLMEMRAAKLPSETGGVLMGVIDVFAKRIDVVDAWDAPRGSRGSPAFFERGTGGLKERVFAAMAQTLDQVRYIGEWHSHPRDYPTDPSDVDLTQILWLTKSLASDGCPALMIIVGDDGIRVCMGATLEALEAELSRRNG